MKKIPYEEPEFLIFQVFADIVTLSDSTAAPDFETETEDDDWGMGVIPF